MRPSPATASCTSSTSRSPATPRGSSIRAPQHDARDALFRVRLDRSGTLRVGRAEDGERFPDAMVDPADCPVGSPRKTSRSTSRSSSAPASVAASTGTGTSIATGSCSRRSPIRRSGYRRSPRRPARPRRNRPELRRRESHGRDAGFVLRGPARQGAVEGTGHWNQREPPKGPTRRSSISWRASVDECRRKRCRSGRSAAIVKASRRFVTPRPGEDWDAIARAPAGPEPEAASRS